MPAIPRIAGIAIGQTRGSEAESNERTIVNRLDGKVAIVTGGAKGIGEATVRKFVAEGASVVIADIDGEAGEALAAELGGAVEYRELDVTSIDRWREIVDEVVARSGSLDILVNNAGFGFLAKLDEIDPELHRRVVEVNQNGVLFGMQAASRPMLAAGRGSIVNISSINGLVGARERLSYVATKFAVAGMTRSAALELGSRGVRVNSVHPGLTDTPLMRGDSVDTPTGISSVDQLMSMQPIQRMARPEEIANVIAFVASDEASYCTGAAFVVDGGHTAGPWREPLP